MRTTLDANVVKSLLRLPRPSGKRAKAAIGLDVINSAVLEKRLLLVLDDREGISSEWVRTAGPDVLPLLTQWAEWRGVRLVKPVGQLPQPLRSCATRLRLRNTIDRLHVRTAVALPGTGITSNDPDFWDPDDSGQVGDQASPVCAILTALGIQVLSLVDLIGAL